ncbi:MAG: transposase [Moorea sp. SIO2C4]|nr:transposase [Moorena sp. SIO2C4]
MNKNRPIAYQQWLRVVIKKMPHLSKPQAVVLGMWSFAIAMTHHCGLSTAVVFLGEILEQPENTIRERLRQWYNGRVDKNGRKRREIQVENSFVPLLSWILSWWSSEEKSLVLAADASTLGQRFTLLVISVVYRGCGIPVAWKILRANEKGSWKPYWLKLLDSLQEGVPSDWLVIVTTDRGLYADWLYEAIEQLGWHPFMRINHQGYYQSSPQEQFVPLSGLITQVGQSWSGKVTCFKTNSLSCTLLAQWDCGYADPWLIVTDLSPQQAQICWYGMRSWIECLFKDIKRGGFGWHHTKMNDPQRAERLWLAIAVATLFLVSIGGEAEANLPASSLPPLEQMSSSAETKENPSIHEKQILLPKTNSTRFLSCFRRGFLIILASAIKGMPLPTGRFSPDFPPAPG